MDFVMEDENDVQLIKESSWTVCHGSLESCINVVFVDPASEEPIVPSSSNTGTLSLVPPEEYVPCEITIKFQGRLCNVQSLYILSTARTYELYSKADLMMDPEYVCTVKGWIPHRGNEANSIGESVMVTIANHPPNSVPKDMENDNMLDEHEHESAELDREVYPSCERKEEIIGSASQITYSDNGLQAMDTFGKSDKPIIHDSVGVENEDVERCIYSSCEDSWVDVKLSGSFSGESQSEGSITAQILNDQIDHQGRDCLNIHSLQKNSRPISVVDSMQTVCTEVNCDSLPRRGCCGPTLCEEAKLEGREFSRSPINGENIYEVELELVDHAPWTSLTVRFLSLQDRSRVEVDQMVLLIVPGPLVSKTVSSNQSLCGVDSSALLAMLVPSMLQMVRGVPKQDLSHGLLLNRNISSRTARPTNGLASLGKLYKDSSMTSCMSSDANSVMNSEVTMKGRQDVSTSVDYVNYENIAKHNTASFTSGTESILSSAESFGKLLQQNVTVLSGQEEAMMNSDKPVEQPLQPVSTLQSACKDGYACPRSCEHEKGSLASNLSFNFDMFLQRFDRLEALCMRMEAYIVKAVESLDQRLQHLEKNHTTLPVYTSLEPGHVTSKEPDPFLSTPNLLVSPIKSGTGCLGANEVDAEESSAGNGITICEESDTQETSFETPKSDPSDVDTAKGGSLSGADEVSKVLEVEIPASTGALECEPSGMLEGQVLPKKRAQVSWDDAWNSALSAFSSSCIPTDVSIFTPVVVDSKVQQEILHVFQHDQSCGSQSDSRCTASKEAKDLSEEIPVASFFATEKLMHRISHPLEELCKEDSSQSEIHNHTVDMKFEQLSCSEEEQPVPLHKDWNSEKTETFLIDLQGHDASDDPFGGVLQFTENDNCTSPCSNERIGKVSNDDPIFDLKRCFMPSIHPEQDTKLSGLDNLVFNIGEYDFQKIRKENLDLIDPEHFNECSTVPNKLIDVQCKEEGFLCSEIALNNILGEENVNDLYDLACSESSTCISQEFDTCYDHFSICEWSSSQNLCCLLDHAMTDTGINKQLVELEEIFLINSRTSSSSGRHLEGPIQCSSLSETQMLDVDQALQQQLPGHTVFPGFEDIL